LPTVSWLYPGKGKNEHPTESTPAAGARFIASKIDAIAANPDVWAKTVFILVYDENDGLFDHVPPPVLPPGTPDEFVTLKSPTGIDGGGLPIGAGFRVPCIIVSPWNAGGWVCSEPFDHTSNLRLLERITGVKAPYISDWRRKTFGDFASVFRFHDKPAAPPTMPDTEAQWERAKYEIATLPKPTAPKGNQGSPCPSARQKTNRSIWRWPEKMNDISTANSIRYGGATSRRSLPAFGIKTFD